ncbi:uncharacterized protein LOC108482165 isoform X1 [Gossypium arboreum]|uniref:uncharacterized protein LOC108482165 isoform X1 n=1 Tax=Gossypium arboreum TaxID=29729 RepID=UPI0008190A9C|nr:uncharacterized protein LOC108482165 isoform X1 [Gossypium arboreum]
MKPIFFDLKIPYIRTLKKLKKWEQVNESRLRPCPIVHHRITIQSGGHQCAKRVPGMYGVEKPSVSVSTLSMKATGGYSCGAKQMGNPRVFENYKKLGPIGLDFSFRYWAIVGSVLGIMGLCWAI